MSQLVRPVATPGSSSWTGDYTAVDEAAASDTDFTYGANNTNGAYVEFLLAEALRPGAGMVTVRYRCAKVAAGVLNTSGGTVTLTPTVRVGATVIATGTVVTTGAWTGYEFTFASSAVTDWADLRVRFTQSNSGGGGNARGAAVSWLEVETPDAIQGVLRVWVDGQWKATNPKVWINNAWTPISPKWWDGSAWKT